MGYSVVTSQTYHPVVGASISGGGSIVNDIQGEVLQKFGKGGSGIPFFELPGALRRRKFSKFSVLKTQKLYFRSYSHQILALGGGGY